MGLVLMISCDSDLGLQPTLVRILPAAPYPHGCSLKGIGASLPTALPVFLLLLSGSARPAHPVWAPGC